MKTRGLILILVLIVAILGFSLSRPGSSPEDTKFIVVSGVFFVSIAIVGLVGFGKSTEGLFLLPLSAWVVFASLATAFAILLLLSMLVLPWLGFDGLEYLFTNAAWLVPAMGAALFPLIRKWLR